MLDKLKEWDTALFYAINDARSNFLDWFFAIISSHWFFAIIVLVFAFSIWKVRFKFKVLPLIVIVLLVSLCFLFADRISVLCFKDVVERLRPSHVLQDVHLVALRNLQLIYDSKGGLYGFVSSHTANLCCIAVIYAKLSSKKKITILCLALWAVLTAYSRVYCGVHYPMDVICGGLLGFVLGEIIYYVFSLLDRKYKWNIEQKE